MKRECIFCGSSKTLSNEHIFPQWLLNEFGLTYEAIESHYFQSKEVLSSRKMNFNNFKNGLVCISCNNGWMSQLENQVKDVLKPIIQLKSESLKLLEDNQLIISKWLFKTAYVLNHGNNYRKIVPISHGRELEKGNIPLGVCIDVGFTLQNDVVLSFLQTQKFNMYTPIEKIGKVNVQPNLPPYIITLKINKFLARVTYNPFNFATFFDQTGKSFRLYPTINECDKPASIHSIQFFEVIDELGHFFNTMVDKDSISYYREFFRENRIFVHGLDQMF